MAAVQLSYLGNFEKISWEMQLWRCPGRRVAAGGGGEGNFLTCSPVKAGLASTNWKDHKEVFSCRCISLIFQPAIPPRRLDLPPWVKNSRSNSPRVKRTFVQSRTNYSFLSDPGSITNHRKITNQFKKYLFPERTVTNHCNAILLAPFVFFPQNYHKFHFSCQKIAFLFSKCGSKRFLVLVKLPKTLSLPQWKPLMHKCNVLILVCQAARHR